MTLERTKEMDDLCDRALFLIEEVKDFEKKGQQCLLSSIVFLVIGVFFFPCLFVAVVVFLMRSWALKKALAGCEELNRINDVSGIHDYLREFYAPKNP